jgi:hypothetical protein
MEKRKRCLYNEASVRRPYFLHSFVVIETRQEEKGVPSGKNTGKCSDIKTFKIK